MKTAHLFRLLVLLSLSLAQACASKKQISQAENQSNACLAINMVENYENITSDFFEVQELLIKDKCLSVILTYSGGCGDVNYEVFYNKSILESYPPQALLKLKFTDNDPCRAIEMDTISIDLAWFQSMARAGGLNIGIEGSSIQATYALPLR